MKTLEEITLLGGSHSSPDDGMCAMEAVAYIQNEPFSDQPACVCPVIAEFMRRWNDDLPDADRNALLKPLLPLVVGTRSTPAVERRRVFLVVDWYTRTQLPAWMDLTPALRPHAEAVRALAPIIDLPTLQAGNVALNAASDAAKAAAMAAGHVAAWVAAAGDAARTAALSAGDAAAAWMVFVSRTAVTEWMILVSRTAWTAVRVAPGDAIKPAVVTLQASSIDLLKRMIAA